MTVKTKHLLDEIQGLSPADQLELVHLITFHLSQGYDTSSYQVPQIDFWKSQTLEEIIEAQQTPVIEDIRQLAVDFWPDDESVDDFIDYIYGQRREDREKDYEDPSA